MKLRKRIFGALLVSLLSSFGLFAKTIEKSYFVDGMHCGGCESGVRASLKELAGLKEEQILSVDHSKPDPDKQIGSVKLRFLEEEYQGKATDCKLAKAIKKNPGYMLFWDMADKNPCKL